MDTIYHRAADTKRGLIRRQLIFAIAIAMACVGVVSAASKQEGYRWENIERVVAIGDVHGQWEALRGNLVGSDIIDADGRWIAGKTHLIITGDFLDRGADERRIMDLLMQLQKQARSAGGRTHVLLGNHEVMNLVGDWRYVSAAGYEAFANMEPGQDRRLARRAYAERLERQKKTLAVDERSFDAAFPDGFFGRKRAFARNGHYGKWLLKLPSVIIVNDVLYVHGGLTPELATLGVEVLNNKVREQLLDIIDAAKDLTDYKYFDPAMSFPERREIALAMTLQKDEFPKGAKAVPAAERYMQYFEESLFSAEGPFWFRGYCLDDEWLLHRAMSDVLERFKIRAMVVGHTPTDHGEISTRLDGRLIRIDVGMAYGSPARNIVWVEERPRVHAVGRQDLSDPQIDPPYGEALDQATLDLPETEIARLLKDSDAEIIRPLGRGRTKPKLVRLVRNRQRLMALFKAGQAQPDTHRYEHEIAAFKVARRLGWQLVPPTIERVIGNETGSLQLWIGGSVDEETALEKKLTLGTAEDVALKHKQSAFFDALIGNPLRDPEDRLWRIRESELWLVDNADAFTLTSGVQWPETGRPDAVPALWLVALERIDREWANSSLAHLLSEQQIDALLVRTETLKASFPMSSSEPPHSGPLK